MRLPCGSKPTRGTNTRSSSRAGRVLSLRAARGCRMHPSWERRSDHRNACGLALRDDARQCDRAAALLRQLQQRGGIELFGHGKVQPDAAAGLAASGSARSVAPPAARRLPRGLGDCAPPGSQQLAQGSALGDRPGWLGCSDALVRYQEEKRRHPPVPVRIVALEPEQQVGQVAGR